MTEGKLEVGFPVKDDKGYMNKPTTPAIAHIPYGDVVYTVRKHVTDFAVTISVSPNDGRNSDWALIDDDGRMYVVEGWNATPWKLIKQALA